LIILFAGAVAAQAASGDLVWARAYKAGNNLSERVAAAGVDSSSAVYATGWSGSNFATVKHDSNGTRKWGRSYNGPGNGSDKARALVVQGQNIYVTGSSQGSSGGLDFATIKYRRNGARAWIKRYDGTAHGQDIARAVTADAGGNAYVTGSSRGASTGLDYTTIKYGPSGKKLWTKRYDSGSGGKDIAYAVSLDSSGNVIVTGRSQNTTTGADYATIMYSSSGTQQWVSRYNGPGNGVDQAKAVSADSSGNVYVTGSSAGAGSGADYATIQYSTTGTQQWVSRYNGPGNGVDQAVGLSLDSSTHVDVTGSSRGAASNFDYATIQYSSTGTAQWVSRYDGSDSDADKAAGISVDSSDSVFVTGSSKGSNGYGSVFSYATVKYDSAGVEQWARTFGSILASSDYRGTAVAVDANGAYAAGNVSDNLNSDMGIIKYER